MHVQRFSLKCVGNSQACLTNESYTPFGQISPVWIHFGYKKDTAGALIKGTCAYYKLCRQAIAHRCGTTNLKNYCLST